MLLTPHSGRYAADIEWMKGVPMTIAAVEVVPISQNMKSAVILTAVMYDQVQSNTVVWCAQLYTSSILIYLLACDIY